MRYLIITKKIWDRNTFKNLKGNFKVFKSLNRTKIYKFNPDIIFFVFWSKLIPEKIFKKFLCIQFHSSDLPKFRGGSPIQNQILRGITKTKVTAFKVHKKLDEGNICLKRELVLDGNAHHIFCKVEKIALNMIKILSKKKQIKFYKQTGKPTFYKRRKPKESEIKFDKFKNLKEIYNFIRSTDADGYPKAFIKFKNFKVDLYDAKLKINNLNAKIQISKKKK